MDRTVDFFDVPGFVAAMTKWPRPGQSMSMDEAYSVFEHAWDRVKSRPSIPEPTGWSLVIIAVASMAGSRRMARCERARRQTRTFFRMTFSIPGTNLR
jgi:hypothetical protein